MIYALKTGFTLLNKKNEFMISAPIRYTAEDIGGTTIYIALNINICKAKSLYTNVSGIWTHQFFLIINKLNMIQQKLLAKMNK